MLILWNNFDNAVKLFLIPEESEHYFNIQKCHGLYVNQADLSPLNEQWILEAFHILFNKETQEPNKEFFVEMPVSNLIETNRIITDIIELGMFP